MVRDELSVLSAYLVVAEERSFTRAAKRLGISTSGLSHAVRRLEERIGVRLLDRTTRSVSPTPAGQQLLEHLRPALADIRGSLNILSGLQKKPVGRVRLLCPRLAAKTVLAPKLGQFVRHYPEVVLEIVTDDSRVDPVAAGFDAAIHFGEFIAQDMVAVRVSPDIRHAVVGAPSYFGSHPPPEVPRDLLRHRCINFRHHGESIYKWELDRGEESVAIAVNGSLVLDDEDLVVRAAIDGAGLALAAEERAAPHLAAGELVRVMEDWTPPFPGYFLYYPHRKQQTAALTAVIEIFRLSG
ncbi:MAG: LysR family transcriptional regulator [Acidobacteria bacterium]|nr:LysR family transcriptional regulator [Acidobacteriota bacterium]